MIKSLLHFIPVFALILAFSPAGCASVNVPGAAAHYSARVLGRFPGTGGPLKLRRITASSIAESSDAAGLRDIFIVVHPGYAFFFRDAHKDRSSDAKYRLLEMQFDHEAAWIEGAAARGIPLILVIPGDWRADSFAPQSFVSYLNTLAAGRPSVRYILSETSSSGSLSVDDTVNIYRFLKTVRADKVMIGGGFIGRCEREFYAQLTTYMDKARVYIVPELSTISPDDITDEEAEQIAARLRKGDYGPVRKFVDRKMAGNANILSLPQTRRE